MKHSPIERAAQLLPGKRVFMILNSGALDKTRKNYVGRRGPDGSYQGTVVSVALKGRNPNKAIKYLRVRLCDGTAYNVTPDAMNRSLGTSGVMYRGDIIKLSSYLNTIGGAA